MPIVYFIKNITNGLVYIGSTKDFDKRVVAHKDKLRRGCHHNKRLQKDFNAHHELIFLDTLETPDILMARQLEEKLIATFINTGGLYNVGVGFDNLTHNPDKATVVKKISTGLRKNLSNLSKEEIRIRFSRPGETNPMWGKTHTPEVRERLSLANKGRESTLKGSKWSSERKASFKETLKTIDRKGSKNSFYGKKHSEETLQKLSAKLKGIKPPNEKVISINGVIYRSMTEASRELGIPVPTVSWRIKSKNRKYTNWFLVS